MLTYSVKFIIFISIILSIFDFTSSLQLTNVCSDYDFKPGLHTYSALAGGLDAGNFTKFDHLTTARECLHQCCDPKAINCDAIWFVNQTCYHVQCDSDAKCKPESKTIAEFKNSSVAHIRSVNRRTEARHSLDTQSDRDITRKDEPDEGENKNEPIDGGRSGISSEKRPLEVDRLISTRVCKSGMEVSDCGPNQVCRVKNNRSRTGSCVCQENYVRLEDGACQMVEQVRHQEKPPPEFMIDSNKHPPIAEGGLTINEIKSNTMQSDDVIGNERNEEIDLQTRQPAIPDIEIVKKHQEKLLESPPNSSTTANGQDQPNLSARPADSPASSPSSLDISNSNSEIQNVPQAVTTTISPPFTHITVTTLTNATILLPQNWTYIAAHVSPPPEQFNSALVNNGPADGSTPASTSYYKYEWSIVSHPSGEETGVMADSNTPRLKLTNLRPGLYTFKITVTGEHAGGDALVNVTVLPPKRANKPPVAIVQPVAQTVQLPNKETVLDGSSSTDDDRIVDYKWEPMTLPIGFKSPFGLELNNTPTLQLKNLMAGFYQLKLTVIDSDHAENSTVANITVLKERDYPPTANAGADVIIIMPRNEVTLNGNQSTDDKSIIGWQWTRAPDDDRRAVDMDGTASPYLHLSKLEVGVYKFILKVIDNANQTSTAEVHVFVKAEQFKGPFVKVDAARSVNLPFEGPIFLDGRNSTDDSPEGIVKWRWTQVAGPKPATIVNSTIPRTIVSDLIPGEYVFQLLVINGRGANATANETITVVQAKNTPPKANAGGDRTVQLPVDIVMLNGTKSWDDFAIVNWSWTREPGSLAAGVVLDQSDRSSILKLANLLSGQYVFKLTVTDKQGERSSDTVKLAVKPPANLLSQVEVTLDADIVNFTAEQELTTLKRLELLLNDGRGADLKFVKVRLSSVPVTRRVYLIFVAMVGDDKLVPGTDVVAKLKGKLRSNWQLIEPGILALDTVICQNTCSGHGVCEQTTKRCVCEAFWMENLVAKLFSDPEPNCGKYFRASVYKTNRFLITNAYVTTYNL